MSERRTPEQKEPGNYACPSMGGTAHPEKHDGKNRQEALAKPSAGYVAHPTKADGKNRTEPVAAPQGGSEAIPKQNLHLDKAKAHADRSHEPKPAKGSKTTKVD